MGRRVIQGPVDHTGRHPIRSTILAAIAAALATIALVLVASGNSALAASSLVNGNFETGDLTGWTVDTTALPAPSGGTASAVTNYDYCYGECGIIYTIPPQEGSYFALLKPAQQPNDDTVISQPFQASNGDKVSGWAIFEAENFLPYDDNARVVIKNDSGTTVATPFEESVSSVGAFKDSGWMYWEYTFTDVTGTGQFQIEARVHNSDSYCGCSVMGLDDVKTSIAGPDTTPPQTHITSGPAEGSHTTSTTSATFEFSSNEQGSTFECQLSKDNAVAQAWANCTSPKSYSNLSGDTQWDATYKFEVRATDPAENVDPTPASRYWFIDTIPDTTAPTVISTVPTADATVVGRTTNVTATFSEDMLASSINGKTFKLFKKGTSTKIGAMVTYFPDDPSTGTVEARATLDPTNSLRSGVTYKAVVTTGAKDLAGNPLAQQYRWFFTVS